MTTKVYYATINCGDGSSSVVFTYSPDFLTDGEKDESYGYDFWEDFGTNEGSLSYLEGVDIKGPHIYRDWQEYAAE